LIIWLFLLLLTALVLIFIAVLNKTARKLFNQKYHYQRAKKCRPAQDCLSCAKSTSEPGKPYDILHCCEIKQNSDVVDENMVCDLWSD
jgi:hypothetical protein